MSQSSGKGLSARLARLSRRGKRALAASLCAASFVGGVLLFGEEPAPIVSPGSRPVPSAIRKLSPVRMGAETPATQLAAPPSATSRKPASGTLKRPAAASVFRSISIEVAREATPQLPAAEPVELQPVEEKKLPTSAESASAPGEENLPPIIAAKDLPRPQGRSRPAKPAPSGPSRLPVVLTPRQPVGSSLSPWMQDIRSAATAQPSSPAEPAAQQAMTRMPEPEASAPEAAPLVTLKPVAPRAILPLQIELAAPESAAEPAAEPKPEPTTPKYVTEQPIPVAPATDFPRFLPIQAQEPVEPEPEVAPPAEVPPAGLQPADPPRAEEIPAAPAEGPEAALQEHFEVIQQTGEFKITVHRSKLLRTKKDIYRTAVVDDSILEIVQFTPREISLIGRGQGSTHVTFWFDDPGSQPVTYLVTCEPDDKDVKKEQDKYQMLEDVINEMFPDSKISITLVADKLLVKGQAKDSEEALQIMTVLRSQSGGGGAGGNGGFGGGMGGLSEGAAADPLTQSATGNARRNTYQIINMLRVPGVQQVALRVKIAELNRSAARNFGLNLQGHIDVSSSKVFLNSMLAAGQGNTSPLLAQFDGDDIQVGLNTLQQHGVIKLLSEPTLVTLSGNPATFIAGGEFAVPTVVGSAGLNAVTTDFRAFGAIISFLPTVVDKDRIRLQVAPEFSQINSALTVNGTPGLKVRAATTTVEMREGQTLAIAGLLEDSIKSDSAGDLAFLQRIIGKRGVTRAETELIILVTPELVHPMEPEEVPPLPGFDVTEPTNTQFYLHGDIEGNPTMDYRSTVWPRLKKRYKAGGPAMTSGPFGHGQ